MPRPPRRRWINALAALVGGLALLMGIVRVRAGFPLIGAVWGVVGFLVLGWALLDLRRFSRGTPESEIGGGHTIE